MQAWSVERLELSGNVEAPQAFLEEATRAMRAHAPLRVEPQRLIQALHTGDLLSVSAAREAVRALHATALRWHEVAERHGLPRLQPRPAPAALPEAAPHARPPWQPQRVWYSSPHELVVDFNALPRLARERFVTATGPQPEVVPVMTDLRLRGGCLFTWAAVGLGAFCLHSLYTLATNYRTFGMNQGPWVILVYAACLFTVLGAALVLLFQGRWRRALPFPPGRYVLPLDFVDATTRHLRIIPLSALDSLQIRHHSSQFYLSKPAFTHTEVTLRFKDRAGAETFVIHDQALGEAQSQRLEKVHQSIASGQAPSDEDTLRKIDPFYEVRHQTGGFATLRNEALTADSGEGPLARDVPRRLQPRFLLSLACVATLVLSPTLWLVRNHFCDEAAFKAALRERTGREFRWYITHGGRRSAEAAEHGSQRTFQACEQAPSEACWWEFLSLWPGSPRSSEVERERLPRAALEDTPLTIDGLSRFLERYPHSGEATEVREQLLPAAELQALPAHSATELRRFLWRYPHSLVKEEAETRLRELFAAAQAELQHQASPHHPEAVQFLSQVLTSLESSESGLVQVSFRRQVAPSLSAAWGAVNTEPFEGQTVRALESAFRQLFADGLLTPVHGESLPEQPEDTHVQRPRIDIRYTLSPSGMTFMRGRQLTGVQFDFDVALRMPGAQPVRLHHQVKPPKELRLDGSGSAPSDSTVHSVTARHAFEQLRGKLGAVFFRADSKAFPALQPR
jgi:hypothetical protein